MERRAFLKMLGGAAAIALPARAWAQSTALRRVAVVMGGAETDPAIPGFLAALRRGLANTGYVEPANLILDIRYISANRARGDVAVAELIALGPDAIFANTTPAAAAAAAATSTIPIVFVPIGDPIGLGLVTNYARPTANVTGFTNFEPSHAGKWLEYLAYLVPDLANAGLIFNPGAAPRNGDFYGPAFRAAAEALGAAPTLYPVESAADIEAAIAALSALPRPGLVVGADIFMWQNRVPVIEAAARHRVAGVYPFINYSDDGGLLSYSVDTLALFEDAAEYVGRILNGARVADLPVQAPQRFQLVINLRTATAAGIVVPPALLAIADRIIE